MAERLLWGPNPTRLTSMLERSKLRPTCLILGVRKDENYINKNCTHLKVVVTYNSQILGHPIVLEHVCFFPLKLNAHFPFQRLLGGLHTCCPFLPYIPLIVCPYLV